MSEFTFIYGLTVPRDSEVRYIGKANDPDERLKQHVIRAKNGYAKGPKGPWILELFNEGLIPSMRIIMKVPMDRWEEFERAAIKTYTEAGHRLLNRHPGGNEPPLGHYDDPRYVANLSEKMKAHWEDPEARERHIQGLQEAWDGNDERRQWLSEFNAQRNANPEFVRRHTEAVRQGMTPEACAKISASRTEFYKDPKERELQSERMKAWSKEHPEEVKAQNEILQAARKEYFQDPENMHKANEKRRARMKALWADPEYKRQQLENRARKRAERQAAQNPTPPPASGD